MDTVNDQYIHTAAVKNANAHAGVKDTGHINHARAGGLGKYLAKEPHECICGDSFGSDEELCLHVGTSNEREQFDGTGRVYMPTIEVGGVVLTGRIGPEGEVQVGIDTSKADFMLTYNRDDPSVARKIPVVITGNGKALFSTRGIV